MQEKRGNKAAPADTETQESKLEQKLKLIISQMPITFNSLKIQKLVSTVEPKMQDSDIWDKGPPPTATLKPVVKTEMVTEAGGNHQPGLLPSPPGQFHGPWPSQPNYKINALGYNRNQRLNIFEGHLKQKEIELC